MPDSLSIVVSPDPDDGERVVKPVPGPSVVSSDKNGKETSITSRENPEAQEIPEFLLPEFLRDHSSEDLHPIRSKMLECDASQGTKENTSPRGSYATRWDPLFALEPVSKEYWSSSYVDQKREIDAASDGIELFFQDFGGSDADNKVRG